MRRTTSIFLSICTATLGAVAVTAIATAPAQARASRTCEGVRATIVGTGGNDRLVGTPRRDVIWAGSGDDVVLARGGIDLVCGGGGSDRLVGGQGDDRLLGGQDKAIRPDEDLCLVGDTLDGGPGDDSLDPGVDRRRTGPRCGSLEVLTFDHGHRGVRVNLRRGEARGQGRDAVVVEQDLEIVGSRGDDRIVGSDFAEQIRPGAGDDEVWAGAGDDRVVEQGKRNGSDRYDMGADDDLLVTTGGADSAVGGEDADELIVRNPRRVSVSGGAGDDKVYWYDVRNNSQVLGGDDDGNDELNLIRRADEGGEMHLDLDAGTFQVDAETAQVGGFEVWNVVSHRPLRVQGSDGPDVVRAVGWNDRPAAAVTADLGGGDDSIETGDGDDHVDGGDGIDTAAVAGGTNTCVNVENGTC